VVVKIKNMKKIILGSALLLSIGMTQAAPLFAHGGDQNILSSALPTTLQSGIKKSYAGYWITDLKSFGVGKHVKYMLTLENADQVVHLRAGRAGGWEVIDTTGKAD
jgi:hypothetical protein